MRPFSPLQAETTMTPSCSRARPRPNPAGVAIRHVLVAVFLLGAPLASGQDDGVFRFRGGDYAPTGSSVARHLTWSSKLPFDKTYGELTASQQAYVRDQYDGLTAAEEPPFPAEGLGAVMRLVDKSADQMVSHPEKGPLVAVAKIDENGTALSVAVYKSPSPIATSAISYAIMKAAYKPARRDGKPVPMDYLLSVELN